MYLNLDIPMPIGSTSEWVSVPPPLSPSLACITMSAGFYTTNTGIPCPTPTITPTPTVTPGLPPPPPSASPTPTPTPTPSPSAGCCIPSTNLKLPGGNVFLNGVTLSFSSTQPAGLSIFTLPNIMSPACLPQQQLINCLFTAPNSFQDWNYTINFSQPVNNVKIQIINYSSSSASDTQEKITFTTNTNVPTIFNCDGCNVLVQNNSIISNPVPPGGLSNGSGAFIISTTTPFNSLTLTPSMLGTNPQGYKVSVFIRICNLTPTEFEWTSGNEWYSDEVIACSNYISFGGGSWTTDTSVPTVSHDLIDDSTGLPVTGQGGTWISISSISNPGIVIYAVQVDSNGEIIDVVVCP
jgi:hypothetical protein